jgi:sugar-specific transcriptional regulator TrmB
METLIQNLTSVGISEKEARVYITLLQLGKASAYSVSERSGLKKPTTYVILGELIKKGLALKVPRVKKQQFIARPPEEFFASVEERLRQAKKALPDLITMAENNKTKVRTLFYEGLNGVKDSLYYRSKEMKGKEVVGFYATTEDASPELMEIFNSWPKNMREAGVSFRVITPEHETTKQYLQDDKRYGNLIKTIPYSLYSSKTSLEAGDIFVRIVLFKSMQSVIIESAELAESVKQIFEMIWNKV